MQLKALGVNLVGLILYFTTNRLVKPIHKLADYSKKLSKGNFSQTIDNEMLKRNDEIGLLAKAYQKMLTNLNVTFTKLELSNNEINMKNRLLSASEKELKSKLKKISNQTKYIKFLANHDSLTKLENRRQFHIKLNKALSHEVHGGEY